MCSAEVDIIEDDGQQDDIQNMLSSIVYSLGLTEEETKIAIARWHGRNIVPPLDSHEVT